VEKYRSKLSRLPALDAAPFILEGNPDDKRPSPRSELNALLSDEAYRGFRVLPRRMVKIKQRQDNIQFAAMVESVDESFGRVLAKLENLGLDDETIVVLFSDNGGMSAANFGRPGRVVPDDRLDEAYSTSNLPLRGGKGWLYEGGVRVPLLVKWPGKGRSGTVCEVPVISTDFYPSMLEMSGAALRPEQHLDGATFAALVRGDRTPEREAIYWHFPHYSNHGMQSPGGAVRCGDYKLIEYFETGAVQLFDLRSDPGEQHDLANEDPQTAARLRAMLDRWRTGVSAQMPVPKPG
jgi:arylsulfatase A-like enzyme